MGRVWKSLGLTKSMSNEIERKRRGLPHIQVQKSRQKLSLNFQNFSCKINEISSTLMTLKNWGSIKFNFNHMISDSEHETSKKTFQC